MPFLQGLGLNGRMLMFAAVIAAAAAVLFSLTPGAAISSREFARDWRRATRGSAGTCGGGWVETGGAGIGDGGGAAGGRGAAGEELLPAAARGHWGCGRIIWRRMLVEAPPKTRYGTDTELATLRAGAGGDRGSPGVKSVGRRAKLPVTWNGNTDLDPHSSASRSTVSTTKCRAACEAGLFHDDRSEAGARDGIFAETG